MLQKNMQIIIFVADHFDVRETTIFVYLCTFDLDCTPKNFEFWIFQ